MKKFTTLLILLITLNTVAQLTYVPDDNFEQALIDLGYDSGALDDYVPTANINIITNLEIYNKNISDLTGIEDFTSLLELFCTDNQLTNLDLSQNTALTRLNCNVNQLENLDVSNNMALNYLRCNDNLLSNLVLGQNITIETVRCYNNYLTNLDVSQNTALIFLICNNNELTNFNVKNGNNTNFTFFEAVNNPNLTCIEVDDAVWSAANWTTIDSTASFSENCETASIEDLNNQLEKLQIVNYQENGIKVKTANGSIIKKFNGYDILGKSIVDVKPNQSQFIIQNPNIKIGTILFIKAQLENGQVLNTKFIKY